MWLFDRLKKAKPQEPEPEKPATRGLWSTDLGHTQKRDFVPTIPDFKIPEVASAAMAMDSVLGQPHKPWQGQMIGVSPALMEWYASQSFIGYPACAMMATHWLIDKACRMPARDAIRQGYTLDVGGEEISEQLRKSDKRYNLDEHMREMIAMGRVYGIRAVLFDVLSTDPDYYEKPFNIDGVMPGCYRGMVQIDPQWITADLCQGDVNDPASPDFMRPSFWRVGNRRYHRSHFHFFIPFPVSTFLRPTYNYGGASVPQRIYERVYGAERTANEAPQLVMTKRLLTFMAAEGSDMARVQAGMAEMSEMMNNYGILAHGPGESFASTDTALGDVDTTTMTQYQLVAAGANVPATKLLGTQPKGFNATGEYEESVYREELESIQSCDLSPLLERHYTMAAKSRRIEIEGELQVQWAPLDSPTAQEWATINKTKAETDAIYYGMQAIDGEDVRERLRSDREGDYYGLAEEEELIDETDSDNPQATPVGGTEAGSNQGVATQLPGPSAGTLPDSAG